MAVEEGDREGRISSSDEQEDVRVIEPPPDDLPARLPVETVIQGGDSEEEERRGEINRRSPLFRCCRRENDEDDRCCQGKRCRNKVEPMCS